MSGTHRHVWRRAGLAAMSAALIVAVAAGCGSGAGGSGANGGKVSVVAAENFWGSIAAQLGGDKVTVTSIITNPNTDPHSYEPTASDARTVAEANLLVVNGVGYDPWVTDLAAANPSSSRLTLNVGQLVGVAVGGNPHRWYSPPDVMQVVRQITADLQKLDPGNAAYFARSEQTFVNQTLAKYNTLIAEIRSKYAGTPIGASESIFAPLAQALGLRLITPPSFLAAISEGSGPTAADKATIDHQIQTHEIKVYVYNSQNATPDVQTQVKEAQAQGIPVTTITETLSPASATFEQWQVAELQRLQKALAKATGH
ncbi:MAG: metal ABC transporter solute-binding protein, Zn/Mn family [Thermoleophilia bacterium]